MLILPLGLDKFGHVLDADLKKKSSLVDRFVNEIFAGGKFLGFVGESISNHLATLVYACVSDQQFFCATKFQKNFCIPGLNLYRFFAKCAAKQDNVQIVLFSSVSQQSFFGVQTRNLVTINIKHCFNQLDDITELFYVVNILDDLNISVISENPLFTSIVEGETFDESIL